MIIRCLQSDNPLSHPMIIEYPILSKLCIRRYIGYVQLTYGEKIGDYSIFSDRNISDWDGSPEDNLGKTDQYDQRE